jgi:peptidoglycan lytic transglycosylase
MLPAIRRIRHLDEAGSPLKNSQETVSVGRGTRRRVSRRRSGSLKGFSPTVCALCALCVLGVNSFGCASRKPIADRRQPSPAQPTETPSASAEAAKRSTDLPGIPVTPPATVATPKRSKPAVAPAPSGYTEEGNASWYGVPFHGRHASNGEIYDMYKLTAAHRTLPFETMVRVTNLNNGKSTVVRITDRGPFVDNRVIDLSLAAAREIESVGSGVVPVRVEVLGSVDPTAGFFTVQVGAFRDRTNAERLRDRLSASYSPVFIQQYDSPDGVFYRVRVGKISGEDAARQFGEQLRARESFTPFVTRLDEGPPAGENR